MFTRTSISIISPYHGIVAVNGYLCTAKEKLVRGNFGFPLLLYIQETMLKENEITGRLLELFQREGYESYFLLDLTLHPNNKLDITMDSDTGVGFEDCKKVSRSLEEWLDESQFLGENYTLEVSSPGADKPLKLLRQFPKHIGRTLELRLKGGEKAEGVLKTVGEGTLGMETTEGKSKTKKEVDFPFETIEEAFVKISFK